MGCIGKRFHWSEMMIMTPEGIEREVASNVNMPRFFIITSLLYGAIFFKGQTEGTIRLRTDEPIGLDIDSSTANDEAIARQLQANEPKWDV
jgi:hypothetical protein